MGGAVQASTGPIRFGAQGLDQSHLRCGEQLREDFKIAAAGGSDPERCAQVDPDHVPARREPQLALTGEQHVPVFVLLAADQRVLAVGAALSVGSGVAPGAGQAIVAAGPAVFGPSTGLEVPAAEGPYPFFAAFSSTCRSVNS